MGNFFTVYVYLCGEQKLDAEFLSLAWECPICHKCLCVWHSADQGGGGSTVAERAGSKAGRTGRKEESRAAG